MSETVWRVVTLTPLIAIYVGLTMLPLGLLVLQSVFKIEYVQGVEQWQFKGTSYFAELLNDRVFAAAVANTVVFVIAAIIAETSLGFLLALLIKQKRLRHLYITIFLLPILVPAVVIGGIWRLMYNPRFGIINTLLAAVGIAGPDWLGNKSTALLSVIIVDIWHWTPFCFLLLLAGLEGLPKDVLEAGELDGANALQKLRYLIVPMMWPVILVTITFRAFLAFKVFDEVFLLTFGGPGTSTEVISLTIYRTIFTENRPSDGAAMAVVVVVFVAALALISIRLSRQLSPR
jgi:multiple sugar transport system permease protein